MMALPPLLPDMDWHHDLRLPADHWVRHQTNDYSVHPKAVGRRVHVRVDDAQRRPSPWAPRWWPATSGCWPAMSPSPIPPMTGPAKRPGLAGAPRRRHRRGRGPRPGRLRPGHRGGMSGARDLAYLCRELKHPSLLAGVERLAERARADAWSHEDFLAACLEREVSARQSHGGEARIRSARFPARKTLEDFDFEHQRSVRKDVVAHLGALDFIEARSNAVFLGPPGTGKSHLSIALGIRACLAGHRVAFATAAEWVDRLGAAHDAGKLQDELRRLGRFPLSSSTRWATSPSRARPPTCSSSWCRPDTNGPA